MLVQLYVNFKYIKIQKKFTPSIQNKKFRKISKVINHEYLHIEAITKEQQCIYNVIDVRMLAQKRNKIMYENMFSNFFYFQLDISPTHPLPKSFHFFLFTRPLRQYHNDCLGPVVGIRLIFVGTKSLRPDWQV